MIPHLCERFYVCVCVWNHRIPETLPLRLLPLICGVLSNLSATRPLPPLRLSSQWGAWCGTTWAREWLVAPVNQNKTKTCTKNKTKLTLCLSKGRVWGWEGREGYESTTKASTPMWKSYAVSAVSSSLHELNRGTISHKKRLKIFPPSSEIEPPKTTGKQVQDPDETQDVAPSKNKTF